MICFKLSTSTEATITYFLSATASKSGRASKKPVRAPEISKCDYCSTHAYSYITDRRGARLPIRRTFTHRNIIYNSVPIYMADRMDFVTDECIGSLHYYFTDESANEAAEVIEAYRNSAVRNGDIKRL